MTQQSQNPNLTALHLVSRGPEVPSRMARLLGAWRARRSALATVDKQAEEEDAAPQPQVEWALRLMM